MRVLPVYVLPVPKVSGDDSEVVAAADRVTVLPLMLAMLVPAAMPPPVTA